MSFADVELRIVRWGEARGIVQHGNPMGQAIKTDEEVNELLAAVHSGNKEKIIDAIGDIGVTLLMQCAIQDINFVDCLNHAYEQIKDRTGYLRADGVFIKD